MLKNMRKTVGAGKMEKAVSIVARLVDSSSRTQAEHSDEGFGNRAPFLKHIREGPERHHFYISVAFADGIGQRGSDVGGIARLHLPWEIPLGPEQRQARHGRGLNLFSDLRDCAAHTVIFGNLFFGSEEIFHGIVGVSMAGNKVDGYMIVRSEEHTSELQSRFGISY